MVLCVSLLQLQFNQDELMCLQEEAEQNLIDAQYTIDQTQLELQVGTF